LIDKLLSDALNQSMEFMMKRLFIAASVAAMLVTPAFAGGHGGGSGKGQSLNINVGVATGKGGLVGALLGTVRGKNGLLTNVSATTGKGGILGLVLGGRGGHGGCGC